LIVPVGEPAFFVQVRVNPSESYDFITATTSTLTRLFTSSVDSLKNMGSIYERLYFIRFFNNL